MTGRITDIQRFSLSDGPGIRTSVFFKGCNLRCGWCHNPETLSGKSQLLYFKEKCIGCGRCLAVCKTGARLTDGGHCIDYGRCTGCGSCADVCFSGATTLSGREATVGEVMAEIIQDIPYYEKSGGGVTLTGGEVMLQPAFALSLLTECGARGIGGAIETNLSLPYETMRPVLDACETVMCDVKHFDDATHLRLTGVGNARILSNIRELDKAGKPFVVRTPLIPGATDSHDNIVATAQFLSELKNLTRYELLNYNPIGGAKYAGLGMANPYAGAKPLSAERLGTLTAAAAKYVPVKVI